MSPILLVAALASPVSPATPSLCQAAEPVTYTCKVKSRTMSICGRDGAAFYRFGRPGRVEVEAGRPTCAQTGFSGGGETQVAFHAGDVSYLVYQLSVRTNYESSGRYDTRFSNGVLVRKGDRKLADIACTSEPTGDLTNGMSGAPSMPLVDH